MSASDKYIIIAGRHVGVDTTAIPDGDGGTTTVIMPREKIGFGADGLYVDVEAAHPLPTRAHDGEYGYRSGTAAASIDVPEGARITRVYVVAGVSTGATVQILGGNTIPVLASGAFNEEIPGEAIGQNDDDVVITGTIRSYYVAWVL